MNPIGRRLAALTLSATLVATACGGAVSGEVQFTDTPTAVTITSGSGNVNVAAGDETSVLAELSFSGDEPIWTAELVNGQLVVDDGCGDRTDCEVNLTVEVPASADVSITTAGGGVTIVDLNSELVIRGEATNVLLNGITGPMDIDLTSGDLLAARLVTTVASFRTGRGDLDVTITEAFESLTVVSDDGNVTAQVPGGGYDIDAVADDGELEIDVDDVDGAASSIVIRSARGDVTIYKR